MKTEFLKSLGLDQDAIDQVMAENGKDINKVRAKLDAATEELDALRASVNPKDARIKELEAKAAQLNDLQTKYDALVASSAQEKNAFESQIADMKRDALLDGKLRDAGAKNVKAVKALLDMSTENWDEQIDALKAGEDTSFMFASKDTTPPPPPSGAKPAPSQGQAEPARASWHDAIAAAIAKQKGE